jgi:hypothetical protein
LIDICTIDHRWSRLFLVLLLLGSSQANHELGYDKDGRYSQNFQNGLEVSVIGTEVAGALWLGNDDPLGHTFWQTVDSSSIADPDLWFQGSCCKSFPSGEVAGAFNCDA